MIQEYLNAATPYLERYGYAAVFVGVMLDNFGLPSPGESLVILGAVLASQGRMSPLVLVVAWAGAVTGDNLGYAIGHFGGRQLVLRFGPRIGIRGRHLARAERFFARYGAAIVAVARFFEGLRQVNGIAAGISRMPWWWFLLWNTLGAALWVGTWGSAAWFLGAHLESLLATARHWAPYAGGGAGALLLGLLVWILWRHHRCG